MSDVVVFKFGCVCLWEAGLRLTGAVSLNARLLRRLLGSPLCKTPKACLRCLKSPSAPASQWRKYLITAPADGKLVFLKSLTKNQYLKAADTLFALMSTEETFVAIIEIPVRGTGKARVGQNVIIKLDDYPYQELGMLEGRVSSLEPSLTIYAYRVIVSLPNGLTSTYHQKFRFRLKMAGTAQILNTDLRLIEHAFVDSENY